MATAEIDIGAQTLSARAHSTDGKQGAVNVLELQVDGSSGPLSVRLHFTSPERLRAAAASLSGLSVEHRGSTSHGC